MLIRTLLELSSLTTTSEPHHNLTHNFTLLSRKDTVPIYSHYKSNDTNTA